MTVPWTTTAGVLVDRVEPGMAGLWSLIRTAQRGVLRCATDAELDRDLAFTFAAMDLGEALEDLEWVHPDLAAHMPSRSTSGNCQETTSGTPVPRWVCC